ncbi:MAG: hypothetical protein WBX22_28655 [Silvibacterium sp.]
MKRTIKGDCTHAYAGRLVLLVIFMALFTAVMHGQELPTAPQIAVKHQTPPLHKLEPLLAKLGNPVLGSADWFRERGLFKLAKFMPFLTHIDLQPSYDKPKEPGRDSRKGR